MAIIITDYLYDSEDDANARRPTPTEANKLARIIYDLYYWRNHLAPVEASYGETGKKIVREITTFTTRAMTILLVVVLALMLVVSQLIHFIQGNSGKSSELQGVVASLAGFLFFLILILPWTCRPRCLFKKILEKQRIEEGRENAASTVITELENRRANVTSKRGKELEAIEKNISSLEMKKLLWWLSISPFALRTIWVWILIIGCVNALAEVSFHLEIKESLPIFSTSVVRTLILVVISYIATNIISELLNLREQYVKGREKMESLQSLIDESKKELHENKETIKSTSVLLNEIFHKVQFADAVKPVVDQLGELEHSLNTSSKLDGSFKGLIQTLTKQISIYQDKLSPNSDETINLWSLSAIYTNIKLQAEIFKERNSLITEFQLFGKILNESLSKIMELTPGNEWHYEIFTALVIPPTRFLNFNKILDNNDTIYASDENWQAFIETNKKATSRSLKHHRHFISIVSQTAGEHLFTESESLMNENVKKELSQMYWYKDSEGAFNERKNFDGIDYTHYPIATGDKSGYEQRSLDYILGKYHSENCCKVLEIDLSNPEGASNRLATILYDKKSKKPIDYYAIRDINTKKWILCFKTIYDETFDSAQINIFHKEQKGQSDATEWANLVMHLNQIFCLDETCAGTDDYKENKTLGIKIFPITKYKDN